MAGYICAACISAVIAFPLVKQFQLLGAAIAYCIAAFLLSALLCGIIVATIQKAKGSK